MGLISRTKFEQSPFFAACLQTRTDVGKARLALWRNEIHESGRAEKFSSTIPCKLGPHIPVWSADRLVLWMSYAGDGQRLRARRSCGVFEQPTSACFTLVG